MFSYTAAFICDNVVTCTLIDSLISVHIKYCYHFE